MLTLLPLLAVLFLVLANGFFVAAEFALVAVRRSRVDQLVAEGRPNALQLQRALDRLDSQIAATQLGITMSSLALGWAGEPAIAHLIEPAFAALPFGISTAVTHIIAVVIAFTLITTLHIVFGELAPKTLALQRPEATALAIVQPLRIFLAVFRPAITLLNGLGRGVVRLAGLQPGDAETHLHSPEELKLLVAASRQAGLLERQQQEVLERVLSIGERQIADVMTPRPDIEWIDVDAPLAEALKRIRACPYEQLPLCRGEIDEIVGIIRKQDLFDAQIDGRPIDLIGLAREPLAVHEGATILKVLEEFRKRTAEIAIVVDEYGDLEGLVTQTDLLAAIAGQLPEPPGEEADIFVRPDGSFLIDGGAPVFDAFARLGLKRPDDDRDFHTIAGFALDVLGRIPQAGESFCYEGFRFEIVDMDGRRIDKLLVAREKV